MKIKQLMSRYDLKTRQSIYDWCKGANIELKEDLRGHKYASPEQIAILDDLKQHLDHGGTIKDYTPLSSVKIDSQIDSSIDTETHDQLDTVKRPVDTTVNPELFLEMVQVIATAMQPKSPLWWQRELERASCSGWLLTTQDVQKLIGVKPKSTKGKKTYQRGCWLFVKSGKIGSQTAWRVIKEQENDDYKV